MTGYLFAVLTVALLVLACCIEARVIKVDRVSTVETEE